MNQNVLSQKSSERIVLNAILAARIYLEDSIKFRENLSNLKTEHNFQTRNLAEISKGEIFTEYLNQELSTFFNPISLDILLSNSKDPNLQIKNFIMTENPDNRDEHFFISDKYIIKYYEGVYKITKHNNDKISDFVSKKLTDNNQNTTGLPSFIHFPNEINQYIQKLEPRFSFGLFTSVVEDTNIKEKTYHIAFRGTEPDIKKNKFSENKKNVMQYYLDDYLNMENHYNEMQPFLDLAIKQLPQFKTINKNDNSFSNCNLEITGHSLGGAMVDLFLEKNKSNKLLNNINYQGYAFGNPFGVSSRTKIEHFLQDNILNPIKKKLPPIKIQDINDNYYVHQLSNKVKNMGNKFFKISTNIGDSLNIKLEKLDDNNKLKSSFLFVKNNLYSLSNTSISAFSYLFDTSIKMIKLGFRLGFSLGGVAVRGVRNIIRSSLATYEHQYIDENFKKIDDSKDRKLISIQHESDLVTYGIFLYEAHGERFLVSDKNTVTHGEDNNKKVKEATAMNFGNHKMYNYVYSCVRRLENSPNFSKSHLYDAITNVNNAMHNNFINNIPLQKINKPVENISKIRTLYNNINNKIFKNNNPNNPN